MSRLFCSYHYRPRDIHYNDARRFNHVVCRQRGSLQKNEHAVHCSLSCRAPFHCASHAKSAYGALAGETARAYGPGWLMVHARLRYATAPENQRISLKTSALVPQRRTTSTPHARGDAKQTARRRDDVNKSARESHVQNIICWRQSSEESMPARCKENENMRAHSKDMLSADAPWRRKSAQKMKRESAFYAVVSAVDVQATR